MTIKAKLGILVFAVSLACSQLIFADPEDEYTPQVFFTKEQALALAFPKADSVEMGKKWLTPAQRARISKLSQLPIGENRFTYFVGKKAGKIMGYVVIDNEIGKSYPITYMVLLSPEGKVQNIEIMAYREPHGSEVRFKSFLQQFIGKEASSDFQDINTISGATLSVRSMTRAVRKTVAAFKVIYLEGEQ